MIAAARFRHQVCGLAPFSIRRTIATCRGDHGADSPLEASVKRGSRTRLELPAESADRLELSDGDTVAALTGPTATDVRFGLAVRRWIDEGAERPMSVEEFVDYLDRCPDSPQ